MNIGARRLDLPGWTPIALLLGAVAVLYAVREVLAPFIAGTVLAYLLMPVVNWIERYFRLSRVGGIMLLMLVALSPISAAWFWLLPPLVRDTQALATALPNTATSVFQQFFGGSTAQVGVAIPASEAAQAVTELIRGLLGAPAEPAAAARAALWLYAKVVLAIIVLAYLLHDGDRLVRSVINLAAPEQRLRVRLVAKQVDRAVLPFTWWMIVESLLTFVVLWLAFGIVYPLPYALPVTIATVLLWLIPFVGPLLAAMFAAFIALGHGSLELAVAVVVFYYLFRLVMRQIVTPRLLDSSAAPHPVLTIFAALSGATVVGLVGAFLAIPIAVGVKALLTGWHGAEHGADAPTEFSADAR